MSHFTRVRTDFKDVEVLKRALSDLRYVTLDNAVVRGYEGKKEKAQLVVQPGGSYDIGFVADADGAYQVVADWWGVHKDAGLREKDFLDPLRQRYAYHKVLAEVTKQGFQLVEERTGSDNTLRLTVRRWS